MLQRAVGSMHALLNDLIDLARLEAGPAAHRRAVRRRAAC
jgi:signal transduction histidine kinase